MEKIEGRRRALQLLSMAENPRERFHMHRLCTSACLVGQAFTLPDPRDVRTSAEAFKKLVLKSFAELQLTDKAWSQENLPIRHGDLRFTLISPFLHGGATSIIGIPPGHVRLATDIGHSSTAVSVFRCHSEIALLLGQAAGQIREFLLHIPGMPYLVDQVSFNPLPLSDAHTFVQTYRKSVQQKALVMVHWRDYEWARYPNPELHTDAEMRLWIRCLAFRKGPGAIFLFVHPSTDTILFAVHWKMKILRYLGQPIYYNLLPRTCEHSKSPMDTLRDHAFDLYPSALGHKHRHDSHRNVNASRISRAAGLDCHIEVRRIVLITEL